MPKKRQKDTETDSEQRRNPETARLDHQQEEDEEEEIKNAEDLIKPPGSTSQVLHKDLPRKKIRNHRQRQIRREISMRTAAIVAVVAR
jgi:hypothetical protein